MMERHPLTFLIVLFTIGALSGVQIGLLILLHRRLPAVRKLLLDVRDNTDDIIRKHGQHEDHP
jgi:hypothetical protein